MATMVCRGLQSCLESPLDRLSLTSTKPPHFPQPLELAIKSCLSDSGIKEFAEKYNFEDFNAKHNHRLLLPENQNSKNGELGGGWSFLQALSTCSNGLKESADKPEAYVHPLVKRSKSKLSEKSLNLCTENLGNETGSDIIESALFSLPQSNCEDKGEETKKETQVKQSQCFATRKTNSHRFPPPLTTIRGKESLRFRPHREDGRLVIKAVAAPERQSCFKAKRSHGRLILCFSKSSGFDSGEATVEEEDGESDEESDTQEFGNDCDDEEIESDMTAGDKEGNNANGRAEMGKEETSEKPCRWDEGDSEKNNGAGVFNWDHLWVSTS